MRLYITRNQLIKKRVDEFTVMLCWWCCHEIPGPVLHMPYKFSEGKFYTCGQFCSWPCMKSYNIFSGRPKIGTVSDLITLYKLKITGKVSPTSSAPSRFALKAFGGTMSIEEFRNTGSVVVRTPQDAAWIDLPIEMYRKTQVVQGEELVLKRNRPLRRDVSGIQSVLFKNKK